MSNGISELLKRYGTSLKETRALMPELTEAVKRKRAIKPPAIPQAPQLFDPAEAKEFGVQLDPGWMLKVIPPVEGQEPKISYITPENWEITQDQMYISPEGKTFTREEVEAQLAAPEVPLEVEQVFGKVFPEREATEMLAYAEAQPEAFLADIFEIGRTPETEGLLRTTFEATPEQIEEFFAPVAEMPEMLEMPLTELAVEAFKETPWGAKPTEPAFWEKGWQKGFPGLMDLMEWLAPTKVGAALGVAGAYIEKYVGRPWEVAILEANARIKELGLPGSPPPSELDREILARLDEAFKNYGWSAVFSEEVGGAWEYAYEHIAPGQEWTRTFFEWTNPIYWIPIGSGLGVAARFTSRIPLIGRGMRLTAGGVQAIERAVTYPVAKPVELGIKGVERVGVRLGEGLANKLIKQSEHLEVLMEMPTSEAILKGTLVDNWMKRTLTIASKVPFVKKGIEKGLGWRILVKRQGQAVEDIVARGAVVHAEIARRGINAKAPKIWELRAIESNPVKLFGFNKKAYSPKMVGRLLPEYAAEKEFAGTLEHVFTHPEMYNWAGMKRGLNYVTKVHEINTEILNLLKKEGVPPENVTQDWWIHRVVEGKFDPEGELIALRGRPGVRGRRRIGAKPSYEMHRKAPTMAEGIAWGIQYNRNPEMAISSYIEGAFKKIADERFLKYVEPLGVLPSERLVERFPELFIKVSLPEGAVLPKGYVQTKEGIFKPISLLRQEELADAAQFHSVINRAIRGEKLPGQTLVAIERRFPELGRRFRSFAEKPATAEKELRDILSANQKLIKSLQKRLEKAEAIDIKAIQAEARVEAIAKGIPDEQKLTEAFKIMDYDDRLAFRSTMDGQLDEIGRVLYDQERELAGINEFLKTDPVVLYHGTIRGKKVPLTAVLKKGAFPETFSVEEAKMLMMGRTPKTVIKGRVPRSVVVDELADHFKMTEQQLIDHIEFIRVQRETAGDLRYLVNLANRRQNDVKRMLGILDNVDTKPEFIPKAEPGMPEAGMQQDIFGYQTPVFPKGRGVVTQISMEDYAKLVETWKKAGLPEDALPAAIRPKIEGVKGLEAEAQAVKVAYEVPPVKSVTERKAGLEVLRNEVKALTEARKAPYWQARAERAFRMEQVRQPGIGEGYLPQPFAGGRIYDQGFIDSFNKFFGHEKGSATLKVTSDVAGILRITKAALDFSAMAIQGLPSWGLAHAYLMFNPAIGVKLTGSWYKAFVQSTRAFFDAGVVSGYLAKNRGLAMNRLAMGGSSRAVDYFAALQVKTGVGGKAEWLMERLPLKPYHRAETSFYFAGEMVRDEFWRILSPKAMARGQEFELARLLDRMTGIIDPASLGVPMTVRQLEQSFVWFAPSYTRACLTVLADLFRGGMTGAEARKAIGGMIAAGSAMYSGVQYAIAVTEGKSDEEAWETVKEGFCVYEDPITGEVEWRPSGKFMTLKVGNYNMGVGGFWYGLLRLAGNISACVKEVGERERIDLVRILKHGSLNKRDNPFIYWWYSRSSPFFGSIFELASGKDFLGYPIEGWQEYAKHIATRFEPIWMEQGLNWMIPGMARDNEIPEDMARAALVPAELFGLRTFPESTWTGFYDKANELIKRIPFEELDDKQKEAWREGKLEWRHLTEMQKANLLSRYPELQEFYQGAQADSAVRDSPHWDAWTGRMEEERQIYYERIEQLTNQLIRGEIDTREYREKAGEAGSNYGSILEAMERDPNYAEIYDFFDKKEAEDKYGFRDDLALGEFQAQIIYAEDLIDSKGDYDWDERDRRVDAFIEKWGQDTYDRIQQYLQEKKGLKDLPEVWIRKSADTEKLGRGYWRLPYKPIMEMDEEDESEGNIPAEYLVEWKTYQALETDEEREAFLEKHPLLAKDWRAEYRKENPEHDARLALWGYGGKLQSREAYDLVTQWGRELGVPLEQMGLGLPPRSLIDNYFEHADLVRETSGGSVEARLYKLEHPEWLAWGVENWGWGDLSDENVNALRLRVEHKDLFAQYEGYGDRLSELYIEDDKARVKARDKLLEENPIFRDDQRRVEAYQLEFPDEQIESYVEYSNLPAKGFEQERYLLEDPEFYKSMIELKDIVPFDPGYKVPDARYDEIYHKWEDLIEQYETVTGTKSQRKAAREQILAANPEFAFDRQRREAYGKFIPEEHVDTYAEWFTTRPQKADEPWYLEYPDETYYGDDWWLMERMEFYDTMVAMELWEERDFSKVPARAVFELYKTYLGLPLGTPRYDFRAKHLDLDAWLVLKFGYKPIEERGKEEAEKTPWEEKEEAERFKEKFQGKSKSQSSEEFGQSEESTEEGMTTTDWKAEYGKGTPHWAKDMEPSVFAKEFVNTMKSNKAKSVLEIGCGNGRDSILFAKSGVEVTSIDITPKAVELAKKNAQKSKSDIKVKVANAEKLPFGDGEFDAVFTLSVLHSTELDKSLPELYRVLRPGGVAFIHIYADTQFKSGKAKEGIIVYEDYLSDIKGLGFEVLKSYKEQEDKFDESGEKHSIFVVSLKKRG